MNFIYSFYPSCFPITSNFYSLMPHQPEHLPPSTVIISQIPTYQDSVEKNDYIEQIQHTHGSSLDQLSIPEPKKQPKLEKKAPKKEISRKKDQNFGWRNQNKDRNMLSAILKGYVQFALNTQGMIKLIENLSKKLGLENGVSSFYKFIADTFPQKKSYVGIKYMKEVLKGKKGGQDMIRMLALTILYYLREFYPLSICQGSKLQKKEKLSLLKRARSIVKMLFQQ